MALKKKLVSNNIEAEYWKIVGFNISITGQLCQVFLVGYLNEETRLEGKNLISKNYIIKKEDFNNYIYIDKNYNVISNLYGYLKEKTEDFKGAEDI